MCQLSSRDYALITQAAELLSDAFYDDPSLIWMVPNPEKRRRAVRHLEWSNLRAHLSHGQCWVKKDDSTEKVLAAALWLPPGRDISPLTYLRHGFFKLPFAAGLRAFRRLLRMADVMARIRSDYAPDRECWYLDTIGVSPDAQGKGLGSAIMRSVLQDVIDPSRVAATLLTSNPINVPFYERLGFQVVHDELVGDDHRFTFWFMTRPVGG